MNICMCPNYQLTLRADATRARPGGDYKIGYYMINPRQCEFEKIFNWKTV